MQSIIPQDDAPQKQCSKCPRMLPATKEFFHADARHPDGLRKQCKTCDKNAPKKEYLPEYPGIVIIPPGTPAKECTRCEHTFPATTYYFHANKAHQDGMLKQCRWCCQKDPEKRPPAPEKDTRKKCPGCGQKHPWTHEFFNYQNKAKGKFQPFCRECSSKIFGNYYTENKEKKQDEWRERQKRNRDANYESYHAREVAYNEANREHLNERQRNNPVRVRQQRAHSQYRRALKLGSPGHYTGEDIIKQHERQKGKCHWCKKKFGKGKGVYHVDHYLPLTRGGSNTADNIVLACPTCNISRNNRLPHEWKGHGRLF